MTGVTAWIRRLCLGLAALGLLASCANRLAEREARLRPLVGQPVAVLIQQLGVPNRSYQTGGVTYLAYDERRIDVLPAAPLFPPWYYLYGGGFPPEVIQWNCETTFTVTEGLVRSYSLRGNSCG